MQNPQTLEDRNLINEKIRFFEEANKQIERLSKVVFQDGKHAKNTTFSIAMDKKMSSHPALVDKLLAADKIALDSPWRFSDMCYDISDELYYKIGELKKARRKLTRETLPNRMKGWVDDHV